MFKKITSFVLVAALVCALSGTPVFGQTALKSNTKSDRTDDPSSYGSAGTKDITAGTSLKDNISKLVADARAGKRLSVSDPQNQPRQSNGLSKGAKIAIGVGIAAAVLLIIYLSVDKAPDGNIKVF